MKGKDNLQKILHELKDKGYKLTPQRKAIITVILSSPSHPSTSEIIAETRKRYPHISVSTVYYTIGLLKKEGLIREIEFYDKNNRYDNNLKDHINLICEVCGKIEDYELPLSMPHEIIFKPESCVKISQFQIFYLFQCML